MQTRILTIEEIREVYEKYLYYDFPDDERKPLSRIEQSIREGRYLCTGAFAEDGGFLAYAFFVFEKEVCLLDRLSAGLKIGKLDAQLGLAAEPEDLRVGPIKGPAGGQDTLSGIVQLPVKIGVSRFGQTGDADAVKGGSLYQTPL